MTMSANSGPDSAKLGANSTGVGPSSADSGLDPANFRAMSAGSGPIFANLGLRLEDLRRPRTRTTMNLERQSTNATYTLRGHRALLMTGGPL